MWRANFAQSHQRRVAADVYGSPFHWADEDLDIARGLGSRQRDLRLIGRTGLDVCVQFGRADVLLVRRAVENVDALAKCLRLFGYRWLLCPAFTLHIGQNGGEPALELRFANRQIVCVRGFGNLGVLQFSSR